MERRGFIGGLLAACGLGAVAKTVSAAERQNRASLYVQEESIIRAYGLKVGDKLKYAVLEDGTFVSSGPTLMLLMHRAGNLRVFTGKRVSGWGPYIQGRIIGRNAGDSMTHGDALAYGAAVCSKNGGEYLIANDYATEYTDHDTRRVLGPDGNSGFTEIFPDENGVYWV